MRRRGSVFIVFLVFFLLSLVLFGLSQKGLLAGFTGVLESVLVPLQRLTHTSLKGFGGTSVQLSQLREENAALLVQLSKSKELEKENQALHDQFATTVLPSKNLLPAQIVGSPAFIPGISSVDEFLIAVGSVDGVKKGSVVVYKDNLVGKAVQVLPHLSVIDLPTHKDVLVTVMTSKTGALGILRGQGEDGMFMDNVVLSDTLSKGDIVVTKGDRDTNGGGYPPNLVVGRIISVNKENSALFQSADVESLLDFRRLGEVFVMRE